MLTRRDFLGTTAAVAAFPVVGGLSEPADTNWRLLHVTFDGPNSGLREVHYWQDLAGTIPAKNGDRIARVDGLIGQFGPLTQPDASKRPTFDTMP